MNPDVPFEMTFPHGNLHPGACIMIHGTSNHGANRFNINFEKLATQEHVFHFDFRFDQRETVRNTKFPSWGHEEKSPLPLHYGGSFTMEIRVLSDRYLVAIDGQHHCEYHHRVPTFEANALKIDGDVTIQMVQITNQ